MSKVQGAVPRADLFGLNFQRRVQLCDLQRQGEVVNIAIAIETPLREALDTSSIVGLGNAYYMDKFIPGFGSGQHGTRCVRASPLGHLEEIRSSFFLSPMAAEMLIATVGVIRQTDGRGGLDKGRRAWVRF